MNCLGRTTSLLRFPPALRPIIAARLYATQTGLGTSNTRSQPRRKAVTAFNDDGRVAWGDLSAREKAARTTQQTFNFGMILVGAILTGGVVYVMYTEVFSPESKTRHFNLAVDQVKKDPRCTDLLGNSKKITAYGEPTWNKWARARPIASRVETDRRGIEHLIMHFNVEGPLNKGVVNLHMTRRSNEHEFVYKYLALDVKGHQRIYLENEDTAPDGSAKKSKLIVAIHGLSRRRKNKNHWIDTWTKNGHLWLRDSLPTHLPAARVMLYKYNSSPFFKRATSRLCWQANQLLEELAVERKLTQNRPLMLIGYSLGGILIKQVVVNASPRTNPRHANSLDAIFGIVFMATPQLGHSDRLGINMVRTAVGIVNKIQEEQFKHLREHFRYISYIGEFDMVVSYKSAVLNLDGNRETILQRKVNHSGVCRFNVKITEDMEEFKYLIDNITTLCEEATSKAEMKGLASILCPRYEKLRKRSQPSSVYSVWSEPELRGAFKEIMEANLPKARILCIIDGLDGCEQKSTRAMVEFLESLSAGTSSSNTRFKILCSSQPENPLDSAFNQKATLKIHDYTSADIENYVDSRLKVAVRHLHPMERAVREIPELTRKIVKMAEGVFIWVKPTIVELILTIESGEIESMEDILDNLPSDLEKLYGRILEKISLSDRHHTFNFLQVLTRKGGLKGRETRYRAMRVEGADGPFNLLGMTFVVPPLEAMNSKPSCPTLGEKWTSYFASINPILFEDEYEQRVAFFFRTLSVDFDTRVEICRGTFHGFKGMAETTQHAFERILRALYQAEVLYPCQSSVNLGSKWLPLVEKHLRTAVPSEEEFETLLDKGIPCYTCSKLGVEEDLRKAKRPLLHYMFSFRFSELDRKLRISVCRLLFKKGCRPDQKFGPRTTWEYVLWCVKTYPWEVGVASPVVRDSEFRDSIEKLGDLLMLFLEYGANPNQIVYDNGRVFSALHAIVSPPLLTQYESTVTADISCKVIQELLVRGADTNAKDSKGRTAMDLAERYFPEAVELLLEYSSTSVIVEEGQISEYEIDEASEGIE
ncbi:hypothetical protein G7Y89_g8828 [Cudoniella acicularis]|uniref:Mitochondrial import inner membrane translocase subunit TIM21 n=1 Tax=Cudoniella acicularis TaxID=354080 RepID=A0A8H4RIP3_9HELO|nr:hypothetical protein G7Y89_g8828 [Cudoniella acicularis]